MGLLLSEVTNKNCGYDKQFEHVVDLESHGVSSVYVQWCNENCKYHWGWHFCQTEKAKKAALIDWHEELDQYQLIDDTKAYLSFESYDEMIVFKLFNLSGTNRLT